MGQHLRVELAEPPGHLDARRPTAADDDVDATVGDQRGIDGCPLEPVEDVGADGERVVELLQPEGVLDDARHVEVVRERTGGDDEHVVRDDVAVVEHDAAPGGVDGDDAAHPHADVASCGLRGRTMPRIGWATSSPSRPAVATW